MQIDHQQTDEAYRNIHEKDESPVKVSDDKTTGDRSEHGANQSWNSDEAHGPDEFRFGKCSHQGEPPPRHQHSSAAALQDATRHKQMDVARYATEKGPEGEETNRGCKYPARSEPIRHPATDRNENCEAQRVAGQHGLHAKRNHLEGL